MSFISYAPNFEDVLLWRALRHVEHGFYLDLQPGAPLVGSLTQAFYARGWRGLNLAATPALAHSLRSTRPADLTLDGAAAAASGSALLYDIGGASRHTTSDAAQAQQQRDAGLPVQQREIALHTLDQLCAQHGVATIHLLHAGDAAAPALAAFDLQRWRPWVILAAGPVQQHLLQHGYLLAHDDGQQRYYADAAQPALAEALRLPPHAADNFRLCQDHPYSHPLDEWRERTARAEAGAEEARTWAMAHVEEWKQKHYLASEHALRAERASAALEQMSARALHAEAELAAQLPPLQARALLAESTLHAVYHSQSWRLTLPLRRAKLRAQRARDFARRLAGGIRRRSKSALKRVLGRVVRFVMARPALAFFVRRQAARLPLLVRILRRVVMQTQAQAADAALAPPSADLQQLPAAARQVYEDLQRSLNTPRR